ncbi:peptidoglycan bridge formation glycyltransferase FemA/FemB family protein [Candidatus Saccharibacteria bacterium]|nr:peptidoglycan bridge formation glycyltransferase FemA/FemB family protein [Candidatus Saccharibacteria bacterium]
MKISCIHTRHYITLYPFVLNVLSYTCGIKRYSFWGIVDENDTKHRFYGVSVFKRGFGVDELRYLPAQDMVIKPLAYSVNWLVETVRRKTRKV